MTTNTIPGRYGRKYVRFTNFSPRARHEKSLGKLIKLRPLRPESSSRSLLTPSRKQVDARLPALVCELPTFETISTLQGVLLVSVAGGERKRKRMSDS
jgi:hypothetical protein